MSSDAVPSAHDVRAETVSDIPAAASTSLPERSVGVLILPVSAADRTAAPRLHDGIDSPVLALARQEWLSWHHRCFALSMRKLWPLPGDSKTARAVHAEGLLPGLQGMHGRFFLSLMQMQTEPVDAFLPCVPGAVEKDLVKELLALGAPQDATVALVTDLGERMVRAAHKCAEIRAELASCDDDTRRGGILEIVRSPVGHEDVVVAVYQPRDDVVDKFLAGVRADAPTPADRMFGPLNMPLYAYTSSMPAQRALAAVHMRRTPFTVALPLNYPHFVKLAMLFHIAAHGGEVPDSSQLAVLGVTTDHRAASWTRVGAPPAFEMAVFCLLARYELFSGNTSGLQGAIPHHVFDALERHCGVTAECFASPLNCHFPRFCSAFPDTDVAFGARGSFFSDNLLEGAFEANPPFVNASMLAMARRLQVVLDDAETTGRALLFFVIVPAWRDAYFHSLLDKSSYLICSGTLHRKEHDYIDGMQHRISRCTWSANVDSSWFVLATRTGVARYMSAGAERTCSAIHAAFSAPVPATESRRVFKHAPPQPLAVAARTPL